MGFTSRDMYAAVDLPLFKRAIVKSQMSYQDIADDATRELRRIARAERKKNRGDGVPESVSKGLVGQLATGRADRTHELRALAIERALGCDPGDLFVSEVVRVPRTVKRSA